MTDQRRIRARCRREGFRVLSDGNYTLPVVDAAVRREPGQAVHSTRFLVDTGASISILYDPMLISALGLNASSRRGSQRVQFGVGTEQTLEVHDVDLAIAGYWFRAPVAIARHSAMGNSLIGHYGALDHFRVVSFYRVDRRMEVVFQK